MNPSSSDADPYYVENDSFVELHYDSVCTEGVVISEEATVGFVEFVETSQEDTQGKLIAKCKSYTVKAPYSVHSKLFKFQSAVTNLKHTIKLIIFLEQILIDLMCLQGKV